MHLGMEILQNKKNCLKLLVVRNEFIHYLAMCWLIMEKQANSYKSLAQLISNMTLLRTYIVFIRE